MMLPSHSIDWRKISSRAEALAADLDKQGLSLAAFERSALFDIDPSAIGKVLGTLRRKGIIWTRRSGSDVRVYKCRPASIAGIFASTGRPTEIFAAKAAPHVAKIAADIRTRDEAKHRRASLEAQEARDRLEASAGRLLALVASHAAVLGLAECRRALWSTFHPSAMQYVAMCEPALAPDSTCATLRGQAIRSRRIASNLPLENRIQALVEKAGSFGVTKSDLCRSIRPRVAASTIGHALTELTASRKLVERSVRVRGSGRQGARFFAASASV